MWSDLVERLEVFPDTPIYHYGSYEQKAFATLARRHGKGIGLKNRLVNLASFIYGRVYYPVRSNSLKVLGGFLGARWTDPLASGLQSLVWRHRWEASRRLAERKFFALRTRAGRRLMEPECDGGGTVGRQATGEGLTV